ncbi:MAG: hypothetical protein ACFB10_12000 [Salibacteraceae bacterium]
MASPNRPFLQYSNAYLVYIIDTEIEPIRKVEAAREIELRELSTEEIDRIRERASEVNDTPPTTGVSDAANESPEWDQLGEDILDVDLEPDRFALTRTGRRWFRVLSWLLGLHVLISWVVQIIVHSQMGYQFTDMGLFQFKRVLVMLVLPVALILFVARMSSGLQIIASIFGFLTASAVIYHLQEVPLWFNEPNLYPEYMFYGVGINLVATYTYMIIILVGLSHKRLTAIFRLTSTRIYYLFFGFGLLGVVFELMDAFMIAF